MSTNPYTSPSSDFHDQQGRGDAEAAVQGPAILLMIVSAFCLTVVLLVVFFNIFLLASGAAERLPDNNAVGITKETQVTIRLIWGMVILASNATILIGAMKMRQLRNYRLSKWSAILAVIPCIGPCYLLGIPFGIWALIIMNRPDVRSAFR